jgi:chromosome partitioning protein
MILTLGGIKGGSGKSTTAVNLAVMRSLMGKTLLIDADEQGSSSDWTDHRIALGKETSWTCIRLKGNSVRSEVLKMAENYDDIIIDCGGRDTASLRAALTVSDVFLVPFQPKSFDIWTVQKVSQLILEAQILNDGLVAYGFINCAGSRGSDNEDAQKIIGKAEGLRLLPLTVGLRKAFSNAAAEGLGVIEMKNDPKAIYEMEELHDAIFNINKTHIISQKSA